MEGKSVLECIEEAARLCEEAAEASTLEEASRHLRLAAAWLEIAKHRALDGGNARLTTSRVPNPESESS